MVLSAINKIAQLNLQPMKKWSTRSVMNGITNDANLIKKCRKLLDIISGYDKVAMLKNILNRREKEQINSENTRKYENALTMLSELSNDCSLKKRYKFIHPLRSSRLTFKKAKELNFKVGQHLWKSCTNLVERKKGKDYVNILT